MEKVNVKISNMSLQYLSLISGLLIMVISIIGCSDVPYTGPTLTIDHVDQYLNAIEQDTVCLNDGFDTVCVKLLDTTGTGAMEPDYTPTVHVHPEDIVYVFYYQGDPILEAKRIMDTTQIVQELVATGRAQLPANVNNFNNGNVDDVPEWIVQIYYPDTFPETNRGRTLETSGFDIRIVEGTTIGKNKQKDLQITGFTQTEYNGRRGVKFSVETEAPEVTIQVNGLVPDNTAIFHISAESVESDDSTNVLQLHPLQ